ncbi:MAG: hypothetical protein GY849_10985, partial [Deltaproteobacteria bacterium]|nr:hypothetical protein [Deltaproteobacteria bacterium]
MIYYVYFDSYGHAREVITEKELAVKYKNDPDEFFGAMCHAVQAAGRGHALGHVGTLTFENEKELHDYLKSL